MFSLCHLRITTQPRSVFLNVGPQRHCGIFKWAWSFHWAYSGPQGKCMAESLYFIS